MANLWPTDNIFAEHIRPSAKRSWLAVFLVLAFVLSGCSGAKSSTSKSSDNEGIPPVAPTGVHDENTCAIEGSVTDDEFVPIPAAEVGLYGHAEIPTVKTAQDGRFAFSNLPPTSYVVTVSKVGYGPVTQEVNCATGTTQDAQITLARYLSADIRYFYIYEVKSGLIPCALGYPLLGNVPNVPGCGYNDLSDPNPAEIVYNKRDAFKITGMVFEMSWVPWNGALGGKALQLSFPAPLDPLNSTWSTNAKYTYLGRHPEDPHLYLDGKVAGKSPLRFRIEANETFHVYNETWPREPTFTGNPTTPNFYCWGYNDPIPTPLGPVPNLDPNPCVENPPDLLDDTYSGVLKDQRFDLHLAFFYNGAPIPPDFTMLG